MNVVSPRATSQFTVAVAGSGKTYGRGVRFPVYEFLPHQRGVFWSNFPINREAMARFVVDAHPKLKLDYEEILDRIQLIPADELAKWQAGESTPADFFKGKDVDGAHIAIDEVHKYCHRHSHKDLVQKWQLWLGELRHDGATFECLSQHEMKVHKSVRDEAAVQRYMFNMETKPDPWFGILMEDWYELRAGFLTGEYRSSVVEQIKQDSMGAKVVSAELGRCYPLDPALFPLYDSYAASATGGGQKSSGRVYQFQQTGKLGLLRWFIRRNAVRLGTRFGLLSLVIWVCFLGGGVFLLNQFMGLMDAMKPKSQAIATADSEPATQEASANAAPSITSASSSAPSPASTRSGSLFGQAKPTPGPDGKISEIDALRKAIEDRDREIERIKADGARFSEIVALFDQQITLRCGVTVDVGEQIPMGPLKGRTIKGISHAKRRVVLDDGTVLPLSP